MFGIMRVQTIGTIRNHNLVFGKWEGATPQLSVHAGIGILYQKGLRSDGKNVYFKGWQIAIQRYNGGGVKNYLQKVNTYISHMK